MRRLTYIFCELIHLIAAHRLYFIAPILIALGVISFVVFYLGPKVVITFIYAGL
jgi:hypothetical protein